MMSMVLRKTDLGQSEIRTKAQSLDMRERRALILMDGSRDLAQVQAIIGASVEGIAKRLLHLGLVAAQSSPSKLTRQPSSMEFRDSLVGKTPATNFESFDNYLPTQSAAWRDGFHSKQLDSAFAPSAWQSVPASLEPRRTPDSGSSTVSAYLDDFSLQRSADHHRALSPRGVLLGKMYLADLVERMLGKNDGFLRSKIQQIRNEEQLLDICEEVMEFIKDLTSPEMLLAIEKRFLEAINKK
jgi:hypothetical protein